TISARRNGIINTTPSIAPANAIIEIVVKLGCNFQMNNAGNVKITPAANDSPVDVIVCTILFSRMDVRFKIIRSTAIEITAAGIEAETVIPTINPKYAFAAPNTIANTAPIGAAVSVIYFLFSLSAIYGLNVSSVPFSANLNILFYNFQIILALLNKNLIINLHEAFKYVNRFLFI